MARASSHGIGKGALIGDTLKDRYLIQARLGRGAMGEVYRATDLRYGEPVAIKMLVADDASDQHRKRFVREISALRKLYHPNIVGYVDAFASEDRMYLVMEYVGGGTLAHTMQSYGQLPADLFMQIARKVIEAIGSAHELGIVHRDLKPTNILLGVDGEPKVADFGLAKLTNFSTITLGGGAMGTLAYMPPEAFEMQALQDHRGDIWAMGVIFYQMLAGSLPFPGQGKAELVRAILQDPPISLEWFRKDLPPTGMTPLPTAWRSRRRAGTRPRLSYLRTCSAPRARRAPRRRRGRLQRRVGCCPRLSISAPTRWSAWRRSRARRRRWRSMTTPPRSPTGQRSGSHRGGTGHAGQSIRPTRWPAAGAPSCRRPCRCSPVSWCGSASC
ncbi:MAG: serine/threonine protein kinase [Anaerolineae bacterium]|nr:serine/threonine protein kinase [Anaerolineae bacterium]